MRKSLANNNIKQTKTGTQRASSIIMNTAQSELKGHRNAEKFYAVGMTGPRLITVEEEMTLQISCKVVNIQFKKWAKNMNSQFTKEKEQKRNDQYLLKKS